MSARTFEDVAIETVAGYSDDPETCVLEAGLPLDQVKHAQQIDAHSSISAALALAWLESSREISLTMIAEASFLNGLLIGIAWERCRDE